MFQRSDVSSSTSRCFMFNAQMFQVEQPDVSHSTTRCFKFNAQMFHFQRPDVSSSTPRRFNVQLTIFIGIVAQNHEATIKSCWHCSFICFTYLKDDCSLFMKFLRKKDWFSSDHLPKITKLWYRPPVIGRLWNRPTVIGPLMKLSTCDWRIHRHRMMSHPIPHALVRFKTEGTGQVRSVTNQNVFTFKTKHPRKF